MMIEMGYIDLSSRIWLNLEHHRTQVEVLFGLIYEGRLKSSCAHLIRKRDRHRTSTKFRTVSFSNKICPRTFQTALIVAPSF